MSSSIQNKLIRVYRKRKAIVLIIWESEDMLSIQMFEHEFGAFQRYSVTKFLSKLFELDNT